MRLKGSKSKPPAVKTKARVEKIKDTPVAPESRGVSTKKTTCSDCSHHDEMHYGSNDRWCNHPGCQCLAYK